MSTSRRAVIYLVAGPSGAGKDTLLIGAAKRRLEGVRFVKRHITRTHVTELEISVSKGAFDEYERKSRYAFSWEANETRYGILADELRGAVDRMERIVLNVSRSQIDVVLQSKFGASCDVCVLHINASLETLHKRLLRRGRDSVDAIERRLSRAVKSTPSGPHVIHILNEASIENGIERVCDALLGRLSYSVWLLPDEKSEMALWARVMIRGLAIEGASDPFEPHVTLIPSFRTNQRTAVRITHEIASKLSSSSGSKLPTIVKLESLTHSRQFFQSFVATVERSAQLMSDHAEARDIVKRAVPDYSARVPPEYEFRPHVSLFYGNDADNRTKGAWLSAFSKTVESGSLRARATKLALVCTSGVAFRCWSKVLEIKIASEESVRKASTDGDNDESGNDTRRKRPRH